jgi:hypothetical protein
MTPHRRCLGVCGGFPGEFRLAAGRVRVGHVLSRSALRIEDARQQHARRLAARGVSGRDDVASIEPLAEADNGSFKEI